MKKIILLVIFLIAVACGSVLYWQYFSAKDPTADWRTYENEKYGYEIKYPKEWQLDLSKAPSQVNFDTKNNNLLTEEEYQSQWGGYYDMRFSDDIKINVTSLDAWIERENEEGLIVESSKKEVTVNGYKGIEAIESGITGYRIIFLTRDYLVYSFSLEEDSPKEVADAFNQMLSTFAIDFTAGWETYRNDEYGFEIKYPPSYPDVSKGDGDTLFMVNFIKGLDSPFASIYVVDDIVLGTRDWQPFELGNIKGAMNYSSFPASEIFFTAENGQKFFIITKEDPLENEELRQMILTFEFLGYTVDYPELATEYISFYDYYPFTFIDIKPADPNFTCNENLLDLLEVYPLGRSVVNKGDYCILEGADHAMGSAYVTYFYIKNEEEKQISLKLTLRYPTSCRNYPPEDQPECEEEVDNFNVDSLADQIISSLRFYEKVENYNIFGESEFETTVEGYLKIRDVEIYDSRTISTAYLVITKFDNDGFKAAMEDGRGNTVNLINDGVYEFNLGCFENGRIEGIEYEPGKAYMDDSTQERIISSSPENPVSLTLSFGYHLGFGCDCCNLAHSVRVSD